MSDDDLIRRGDVFRVIHGVAEFKRDVVDAYIDNIPAAVSPAERLALDVCRDLAALLRAEPFPAADARWAMLQRRAEDAYRASAQPPVSDGKTDRSSAQPEPAPKPSPGVRDVEMVMGATALRAGSDLHAEAQRIYEYAISTDRADAVAAIRMALESVAEPAESDGKSNRSEPAKPEPAILQKPPGSCNEAAVRCNNPEPAAQPFRHGRCCAEEPEEPAKPEPVIRACVKCRDMIGVSATRCGKCGAEQPAKKPAPCVGTNCANPRCNYMVPCGMICNKCGSIAAKAACSACRAKEPAPCGRCGGSGSVWDGLKGVHVSDGNAMKPCPSCSPGGGA